MHLHRSGLAGASALAGSLFILPALAQQPPPLAEVVVTSKIYERPVGQTVTTIDRDQFKNSPVFSIGQVLQYSPGVTVKQGNGPRDVGISIRGSNDRNGFGIRNIQVLEDGFPVTQPDGLSRTDLTDPRAYAGIDVYQGPSSVLFGNYATGGAINFRTRPGSDIQGAELGSDAGGFGYFNTYLTLGDVAGPFEYSLFGSHARGSGFIANSGYNTTTENLLASYQVSADDKLTLKFVNNNLSAALPIRLSLNQFVQNPFQQGCLVANAAAGCGGVNLFVNGKSGAAISESAAQAGLGRHDQRSIVGARWDHAIDPATDWRVQFVFDNKDINQPTGTTSALGTTPAYNILSDITRHGTLFGLPATHFAGAFFNYEDLSNDTYNLTPAGNATLGALSSAYTGHHENFGVRAREEIAPAPDWTATFGVSAERTLLQAVNTAYTYPLAGAARAGVLAVQREFLNLAYEAALRYRPDEAWELHARTATAYGTPQASNLFVTPQGVAGNNTQLATQTNRGFDLGADWAPAATLKIGVTGFYEFFKNELVTQSPGAGLQSFTFNAPASEHRGVEVNGVWLPAPGWRFTLAYTYDDQIYTNYQERLSAGAKTALFNRDGNTIPGVQPHYFTARLGYDQPDGTLGGLGAYAEFDWRGAFFMDNANLVQAPGYHLVNLNLHYAPDMADGVLKGLNVFFEIDNVFDKTYVASANNVSDSLNAATGAQNPASVVASATGSIYAGAPRTFLGGVRLKF